MSTTTFRQQVEQMLHTDDSPDTPPSKFARIVWYIFKWLVIIEVFCAVWYTLISSTQIGSRAGSMKTICKDF